MDCHDFDGQVVRLERLKDVADKFIRVRLTRIEGLDLNLFDFDYDLTFIVFFLNAEEKVYARYGGRDDQDADNRQSLAGLKHTMASVLRMHERDEKSFAPRSRPEPRINRGRGGCMHCHQVRQSHDTDLRRAGKWSQDDLWRYPLPENLGFKLEVDRGNVVQEVKEKSPAAAAGLEPGDTLQRLNGVPVHSFADAQFALDLAPKSGAIEAAWLRDDKLMTGRLALSEGWRRTDVSWRRSLQDHVPSVRLFGRNLPAEEKKTLGLSEKQLAFRHRDAVHAQAAAAGIRAGDIIIGLDDQHLEMESTDLLPYVRRRYVIGDRVTVNLLREGKRMSLAMTLVR